MVTHLRASALLRRSLVQSSRSFSTSLTRSKDTAGLKKLYSSAEEAVADVKGDSVILSGGEWWNCVCWASWDDPTPALADIQDRARGGPEGLPQTG